MKRPTLIVVEDAPNHGAILQDHVAGRFFLGNRGVVGVDRLDHNRGLRQCLRFLFDPLTPLFQDRPLNTPQATHLLPHLNLGVAVGIQNGLGGIPQEMVVAIAVRHLRKFCRDSRHEGVLLVRHPEDHALAQNLGPLLGLSDQALNLWGRCREQRLSKPNTLLGQFAHDVKGLVPFLGLKAVNGQDDVIDAFVLAAHSLEVLLARGEHGLIALDVESDAGLG